MYFLLLWYIFEGGILGRLLLTLTVKYVYSTLHHSICRYAHVILDIFGDFELLHILTLGNLSNMHND